MRLSLVFCGLKAKFNREKIGLIETHKIASAFLFLPSSFRKSSCIVILLGEFSY